MRLSDLSTANFYDATDVFPVAVHTVLKVIWNGVCAYPCRAEWQKANHTLEGIREGAAHHPEGEAPEDEEPPPGPAPGGDDGDDPDGYLNDRGPDQDDDDDDDGSGPGNGRQPLRADAQVDAPPPAAVDAGGPVPPMDPSPDVPGGGLPDVAGFPVPPGRGCPRDKYNWLYPRKNSGRPGYIHSEIWQTLPRKVQEAEKAKIRADPEGYAKLMKELCEKHGVPEGSASAVNVAEYEMDSKLLKQIRSRVDKIARRRGVNTPDVLDVVLDLLARERSSRPVPEIAIGNEDAIDDGSGVTPHDGSGASAAAECAVVKESSLRESHAHVVDSVPAMPCDAAVSATYAAALAAAFGAAPPAQPPVADYSPGPNNSNETVSERLGSFPSCPMLCVARSVDKAEVSRVPEAQAALAKEWRRLRDMRTWDESGVREWAAVRDEARRNNATIHVGRIFEICVEKGSGHVNLKVVSFSRETCSRRKP